MQSERETYEISRYRKELRDILHRNEFQDHLERWQFNRGTEGEDEISHVASHTPSFITRLMCTLLKEHDKVLFPGGIFDRSQVARLSNPNAARNKAADTLEDNEILTSEGEVMTVEEIQNID